MMVLARRRSTRLAACQLVGLLAVPALAHAEAAPTTPGQTTPGQTTIGQTTLGQTTIGQTTWTTYLYTGPGSRYAVADEVPQAQAIRVLGCANGWCQISYDQRTGYVEADVVVRAGEDPAKPPPGILAQPAAAIESSPKGPCVLVEEKGGNGGNAMTYVCQK